MNFSNVKTTIQNFVKTIVLCFIVAFYFFSSFNFVLAQTITQNGDLLLLDVSPLTSTDWVYKEYIADSGVQNFERWYTNPLQFGQQTGFTHTLGNQNLVNALITRSSYGFIIDCDSEACMNSSDGNTIAQMIALPNLLSYVYFETTNGEQYCYGINTNACTSNVFQPLTFSLLASGTTPMDLTASVISGVQETGKGIWPLFSLVGVSLAFIIGLQLIVFTKRATYAKNESKGSGSMKVKDFPRTGDYKAFKRGKKANEDDGIDLFADK